MKLAVGPTRLRTFSSSPSYELSLTNPCAVLSHALPSVHVLFHRRTVNFTRKILLENSRAASSSLRLRAACGRMSLGPTHDCITTSYRSVGRFRCQIWLQKHTLNHRCPFFRWLGGAWIDILSVMIPDSPDASNPCSRMGCVLCDNTRDIGRMCQICPRIFA
ncbi:hypothetical protein PLICRDRAFT_619203 [Plicaturopsis crispa FD-325 SS-3]|nr:hypothetical protein PLICRDRAFT_619203 [Plicaturopsis crispa FD-325 SS-3]